MGKGRRGRRGKRGRDITEQIFGTRVLAGIASSSRGPDSSAVVVVNRNGGRDTAQTTEDPETAQDRRGMGQELTDNRVPKDVTLPETAKASMGKEASSALPGKEKDTSGVTAVTNLESEEPRSKSCNSREKKASETALDRRGTGQEIIENKVSEDGTLAETAKASMGKEASSALTIKNEQSEHAESKKTASEDVITLIVPSANPDIRSQPGTGESKNDIVQSGESSGLRDEIEQATDEIEQANDEIEQDEIEQANEEIEQANDEIEQANDEITVPSPSADPEIYRLAFGSIRLRPWVPQSDGIELSGPSGERPSDEQTTEDTNRFLYGVSSGFHSRMQR